MTKTTSCLPELEVIDFSSGDTFDIYNVTEPFSITSNTESLQLSKEMVDVKSDTIPSLW